MDVNVILQIIGSLGFPIAAYLLIFWELHQQQEEHKEEMEKITAALNNNTAAILELSGRLKDDQRN